MPVIIVEMWEGRTIEQKKQLAQGITDTFVKQGTPPQAIHIIFRDNQKCNWADAGKLASEQEKK